MGTFNEVKILSLTAPPLLNANTSLTNIAESSSKTITYVLPPNTFSEENGPIEYYGIYITIGG